MGNGFRSTCARRTKADICTYVITFIWDIAWKIIHLFDSALIGGIRTGKFIEDPVAKCYTKCIMGLSKSVGTFWWIEILTVVNWFYERRFILINFILLQLTKKGTIDIDMMILQIGIMALPDTVDKLTESARKCHAESNLIHTSNN